MKLEQSDFKKAEMSDRGYVGSSDIYKLRCITVTASIADTAAIICSLQMR